MVSFLSRALVVAAGIAAVSGFSVTGPSALAPRLRTSTGVSTICMGRKGAQTGLGGGNTRTVTREKKNKTGSTVTVVKVKKVTGVDVTKSMILKKLETATKDNFDSEILNSKVEAFLKEEAGATMYPKLMKKIKFTAGKLGAKVPDGWCYEANATKKYRDGLARKAAEAAEAAAAPAEEEAEAEPEAAAA
jgi:hypothetical protein